MEHTVYKFTIKFAVSDDIPAKEVIPDYILMVTRNMAQECVDVGDIRVTYWQGDKFAAHLNLVAKDYGVPQVSVVLTATWIKNLYRESIDNDIKIEAIVIHPRPDTLGAVIKWDWTNDCPIVKFISTK